MPYPRHCASQIDPSQARSRPSAERACGTAPRPVSAGISPQIRALHSTEATLKIIISGTTNALALCSERKQRENECHSCFFSCIKPVLLLFFIVCGAVPVSQPRHVFCVYWEKNDILFFFFCLKKLFSLLRIYKGEGYVMCICVWVEGERGMF